MKIAILDDYQDCVATLDCFARLAGHEVVIVNETLNDPAELAARIGHVERDSDELYFGIAFDNVVAFAGGTPVNIVTA